HASAAAHRRSAVTELLALHRLPLAAVGDRVEPEVTADGVHLHQIVARVGGDAAVAIEARELAAFDRVDLARRDAEVLAALRGRCASRGEPGCPRDRTRNGRSPAARDPSTRSPAAMRCGGPPGGPRDRRAATSVPRTRSPS